MTAAEREMALRYAGDCSRCGARIEQGVRAIYDSSIRKVRHIDCDAAPDRGTAGASAYREYERRTARDQARVTDQKRRVEEVYGTGLLGKVATFIAVDDRPRRSTEVWAQGAVGEERVATFLDKMAEVGVVALHDRRIPGTRANIDHIAITPWGVWLVDAKRYLNKRPQLVTEGGFLGIGRTDRLVVGGRRKDGLIDGMLWQLDQVKAAVGPDISVRGALAFVDADWPLLGGDFAVRGVAVVWPRRLARLMLSQQSPVVDVAELEDLIAARFPPA